MTDALFVLALVAQTVVEDLRRMVSLTFMQYALVAAICAGVAGPLLGSYLVHRGMALVGDALGHVTFGGVAVGFLVAAVVGWEQPLIVALVFAVLAALGMQHLSVHTDAYGDVPVAVLLTGGFAVGVLVINFDSVRLTGSIEDYLFGNVVLLSTTDLYVVVALTVAVVGTVVVTHKQMLYATFDREAAAMSRVNVGFYDTLLVVLTAGFVVASIYVLGVILVAAMLVVPAAAAMQTAGTFRKSMVHAVVVGQFSAVGGVVFAYLLDLVVGPTIVVIAISVYVASVVWSYVR